MAGSTYPRILIDYADHSSLISPERTVPLSAPQCHYLTRVRRLRATDKVVAVDGQGGWCTCTLIVDDKHKAYLVALEARSLQIRSSSRTIRLGLAVGALNKFQFALQKITEIGIDEIIPVSTTLSTSTVPKKALANKLHHWREIVLSAFLQSQQLYLPVVQPPIDFDRLFASEERQTTLLFDRSGPTVLSTSVINQLAQSPLLLIVGPEGGFTEAELEKATEAGAWVTSIGTSTLRFETAAIVAATAFCSIRAVPQ